MRHAVLATLLAFFAVTARAQDGTPPPAKPPEQAAPKPPEQAPAQPQAPPQQPPARPPAVGAGVDWFPLESSRRWKYSVSLSIESTAADDESTPPESNDYHLEVSVVGPQMLDGKQVIEVQWKVEKDLAMRDFYEVDQEHGIVYCVKRIQGFGEHMKEYTFDRPQQTARQDMQTMVGQGWTWEGKAGPAQGTQKFTILREEKVETPAGTFDTLVVQIEFQGEDESRGTTTRWLARGVGIVQEKSEIRTPAQIFRTEGRLDRKWSQGE